MTKEELIQENTKLVEQVNSLRNKNYSLDKDLVEIKWEYEDSVRYINRLKQQIHFLAGMLYKEWIEVQDYQRLEIIFENKEKKED